jgi:F5/8 type C domain-containing protein
MRRFFSPPVLAAAGVYVLLTAALTWPLVLHPARLVPNDLGDPLLNTWILAWDARVVPLTARWWNGPQFYPVDGTMAFSEHLLGLTIITTPVMLAGGSPLLAYNIAFFLSFVLSGLSAYFLAFTISRRHDCAFLAGLAFAFAPYRMAQFAHVQVLSSYWMPIALAALHRYFDDHRGRWLAVFAAAWLMQALSCGYYLFYLSVLIGLWVPWFVRGPLTWRLLARVAAAWAAAALLLVPVLYGYWRFQHAYGLRRGIDEIVSFSADVASVLKAPVNLRVWGWLDVVRHPESDIFPGVTVVVLVVAGLVIGWRHAAMEKIGRLRIARAFVALALLFFAIAASPFYFGPWKLDVGGVRLLSVGTPHKPLSVGLLFLVIAGAMHPSVRTAWRRRSALAFYALATVAMWLLSLGPAPTLLNKPLIYKAPYAWLMLLPGVDGIRVPARFWMLAALCLSIAAALAMRQLTARWPRLARALPAAACIGILMDSWPLPMRMEKPPAGRPVHTRAVARLELPANPSHDSIALYRAIEHRRPLLNGYSGYFAPHYGPLQVMLKQHDPDVLTRLSSFGPLEVVIDHDLDEGARWRVFLVSHPQASLVYRDDRYSTFRVERGPHVGRLPKIPGEPLPIASISAEFNAAMVGDMIDHDIMTRWHCGREQRPGDAFTVDLGNPREVSGAELLIAGFVVDFPRTLSIDTSIDGQQWSQAWKGATAVLALSAALEDPLNIPMPFGFEPRPARYVRFTQLGTEETYYWSVAELRIMGMK